MTSLPFSLQGIDSYEQQSGTIGSRQSGAIAKHWLPSSGTTEDGDAITEVHRGVSFRHRPRILHRKGDAPQQLGTRSAVSLHDSGTYATQSDVGLTVVGEAVGRGGVGATLGVWVGERVGTAVVGAKVGRETVGLDVVGIGVGTVSMTNGMHPLLHVDPEAQSRMRDTELDVNPVAELIDGAIISVS